MNIPIVELLAREHPFNSGSLTTERALDITAICFGTDKKDADEIVLLFSGKMICCRWKLNGGIVREVHWCRSTVDNTSNTVAQILGFTPVALGRLTGRLYRNEI